MNIIGLQLILLFFAIFMIYVLFLHWKKKQISLLTLIVWLGIWASFIFVTLFPSILHPFLRGLFLVRVIDLGTIVAIMIIMYLTFENNVKIKKFEKEMEEIVRTISHIINSNDKKQKNTKKD